MTELDITKNITKPELLIEDENLNILIFEQKLQRLEDRVAKLEDLLLWTDL